MKPILLLLASLAGCYRPDFSAVRYTCDVNNPYCPDGLTCVAGVCGGAEPTAADMAMSPPSDGPAGDAAAPTPDLLYAWDSKIAPSAVPGCRGGRGWRLTDTAVACAAALSMTGDIGKACAAPFTLCSQMPLPFEACASVPWGFFASLAVGWQSAGAPPIESGLYCGGWRSNQPKSGGRLLFGCGQALGIFSATSELTCAGFPKAVGCDNGSNLTAWACPVVGAMPSASDFDSITNSDPSSGVLCCR